jgi:hypothetical protein
MASGNGELENRAEPLSMCPAFFWMEPESKDLRR